MKIFIIDDDTSILDALSLALTTFGHDVDTTATVDDVVAKAEAAKPQLILLDLFLSGAHGTEIAKLLRTSPILQNIRIIAFSAHPNAKEIIADSPIDGLIAKPFSLPELLETITK